MQRSAAEIHRRASIIVDRLHAQHFAAALVVLIAFAALPGGTAAGQTSSGGLPDIALSSSVMSLTERDGSTEVTVTAVLQIRRRSWKEPSPGTTRPDRHRAREQFPELTSHGGSCLRGDVARGFSLVVHAGGPVDGLEDCARARGVTALYALREGRYVSWFAGAPGFVNEPFAELWEPAAHGEPATIPAGTPLLAASVGPPSADPLPGPAIPAWPWSRCLGGQLVEGFSLVLYEGGDVEALAACARQLSVDAVYVLAAGEWVSYFVGAPDFVNRPFAELFAGGLPLAAPLVVRGAAGERVAWTACDPDVECGYVDVPADYRTPGAGSIAIAVNVHRARSPGERIGYLLVNPGGPGGSGLELVLDSRDDVFAEALLDRFDIVGFDPRGVGASEPAFACGEPGEQLALLAGIDLPADTPEEFAAGEAAARLCIDSMGPVGGLLHSEYVARDMDEIRKALGAPTISYLGFSYGSTLGVWYATLFPGSVRAMAVDAADNPVDEAETREQRVEEALEELAPFELGLERALTACADPECPIYNDGDPVGYYRQAAAKLGLVNEAAGGHPQAGALAVLTTLYSEEYWPHLWAGLAWLQWYDEPETLLAFAKVALGEEPGAASFTAHVNCLDGLALNPRLDRATQREDDRLYDALFEERLPLLALLPGGASACPFYDQFAPPPFEEPLDGGGVPILVVGNHSDPATPFGESEELVTATLANGYLVETWHPKHVVYPGNTCVNELVHRVLLDGEYPGERRVVCAQED